MWKQVSITKPPVNTYLLFGYYSETFKRVTRVEDAFYSTQYTNPWIVAPWANVWMELPQSFEPGHL